MSTHKEAGQSPSREQLIREQIAEMRDSIERTERFRAKLSEDNARGHDFLLRCLVELETKLQRLLVEAASLSG